MTWIVGTPTAFGSAIAISDIRASWEDGRALDCVQKIYPVGADLAAGFSGGVQLGFKFIEDLRDCLRLEDPKSAWKPRAVALKWSRRAKWLFRQASNDVKRSGAHLMVL